MNVSKVALSSGLLLLYLRNVSGCYVQWLVMFVSDECVWLPCPMAYVCLVVMSSGLLWFFLKTVSGCYVAWLVMVLFEECFWLQCPVACYGCF